MLLRWFWDQKIRLNVRKIKNATESRERRNNFKTGLCSANFLGRLPVHITNMICPWYDTVIHSQLIIILHPIVLKPNTHWNQCYQHTLGKNGCQNVADVINIWFRYTIYHLFIDFKFGGTQRKLVTFGTTHAHSETTRRRKLLCTYSTCFFHQKRQKRSKVVHAPL